MTGHSRWQLVRAQADPMSLEVQMAYVDGYILALEDLLRDLDSIRIHEQGRTAHDANVIEGHTRCWKQARRIVGMSLHQARENLRRLKDTYLKGEGSGTVDESPAG